ncbi:hypothetical protein TNCV_458731 [Trichonephila clavipes]|nr:hypothetical protein TNCV_458731 [Trichonephila clavipes]
MTNSILNSTKEIGPLRLLGTYHNSRAINQRMLISVKVVSMHIQRLKNAWEKLWPDLESEKYFNDNHREEINNFVQSIPGFQEGDEDAKA